MKTFELGRIVDTRLESLSASDELKAALIASGKEINNPNFACADDAETASPAEVKLECAEQPESASVEESESASVEESESASAEEPESASVEEPESISFDAKEGITEKDVKIILAKDTGNADANDARPVPDASFNTRSYKEIKLMSAEDSEDAIILMEKRKKQVGWRRAAIGTIAACLCLFIGISVLGANVQSVNDMIYEVSPKYAEFLWTNETHIDPVVELSNIYDGIEIEVESAIRSNQEYYIILKIHDLELERIGPYAAALEVEIDGHRYVSEALRYNDDERCATALVTVPSSIFDGRREIDIKVSSIFLGVSERSGRVIPIDFSYDDFKPKTEFIGNEYLVITEMFVDYEEDSRHEDTEDFLESALNEHDEQYEPEPVETEILKIGEEDIKSGMDFAYISNVGYIDGKLHVQICYPRREKSDDPFGYDDAYLSFGYYDEDTESTLYYQPEYKIELPKTRGLYYTEYVYNITPDQFKKCGVMQPTQIRYSSGTLDGEWHVIFETKSAKELSKMTKTVDCSLYLGDTHFDVCTVTPLSLTLDGVEVPDNETGHTFETNTELADKAASQFHVIEIIMHSGEVVRYECIVKNDEVTLIYCGRYEPQVISKSLIVRDDETVTLELELWPIIDTDDISFIIVDGELILF